MERIADALNTSLPALLEETDLDSKSLKVFADTKLKGIAKSYDCKSLILPASSSLHH
jgi:hypothetical protein